MEQENNKKGRTGRIVTAAALLLSFVSTVLAVVLFIRLNDLEERLKSVSFNSYVEQTVVSNNYIVTEEEDPGQVTVSFRMTGRKRHISPLMTDRA